MEEKYQFPVKLSNVHCRFLKEEWQYLDQEKISSSDLPFAESVWRHLPNKITDKVISVNVVLKSFVNGCKYYLNYEYME